MSRKVFIKTIVREDPFGLYKINNKIKIGRARDTICALPDRKLGRLATGLQGTITVDGKEVPLQTYLEKKHGVPPGYYTDRLPTGRPGEEKTFFQEFRFKLNDGTTILDLDEPLDEIKYYLALASKLVANSWHEFQQGKWPEARYYVAREDEEEAVKINRKSVLNKALAALEDEKLSDNMKIQLVKTLDLARGEVTRQQAYLLLDEFIKEPSGSSKVENAKLFLDLIDKTKTKEGREWIAANALLSDLVYYHVLRIQDGDTYVIMSNGVRIGTSKERAIQYLLDPDKQDQVNKLKSELKAKLVG